ncbi:MAG TPA: FtsQ-type POTRA domain-containing protein [Thermoanaerobaculia bacterium]
MSASYGENTQRFLRPLDAGRVRRNQRRIQAQRILGVLSKIALAIVLVAVGLWIYQRTQSDARFAVKQVEISGAKHTPRAALASVTAGYTGTNLFRIDIARVQNDLRELKWVSRIDIEKKLPDTLRINVTERTPVALVRVGERIEYVDERGITFAELSPEVGDDDLILITGADGDELARAVALVRALRTSDPLLYSRISELRPIAPRGFAMFDRELGAIVYANAEDASPKWRDLYSIVKTEHIARGSLEYADLRFADRIVIRPVHPKIAAAAPVHPVPEAAITN